MEEPESIPLDALDIEWVEPRICAETFENRRELRRGRQRWKIVPPDPETGMPSGLIEVPDPSAEQQSMLQRHADLLVNSRDPWSDFVDVRELPLDATGVPYWIHKRVEKWHEWEASEGKPVEPGTAGKGVVAKAHAGTEPYLPVRCNAIKKDGNRCWAWAADRANNGKCRAHAPGAALAANMGHQIALAKLKIMQAQPAMADMLEDLAENAVSEQVRLKAITEMMDRGGVHAATEVNIGAATDGPDPASAIRERLASLGERLAAGEAAKRELERQEQDIVDAEIVSETEERTA